MVLAYRCGEEKEENSCECKSEKRRKTGDEEIRGKRTKEKKRKEVKGRESRKIVRKNINLECPL